VGHYFLSNPRIILLRPRAQGCHGSEEGLGGSGLHLGNRMGQFYGYLVGVST